MGSLSSCTKSVPSTRFALDAAEQHAGRFNTLFGCRRKRPSERANGLQLDPDLDRTALESPKR